METPPKILLIEDTPADAALIRAMLAGVGGHEIVTVTRLASGLQLLEREDFAAVLLDLGLPDSSGIETLLALQAQRPEVPVVVLTGLADEELAAQAIRQGAQDYLAKGRIDGDLLSRAIRYAIERKKAQQLLNRLENTFRAFFDSTGVGAVQLDGQTGRFVRVNDRFCRITGYSRDELLAMTFRDLTHPDDREGDAERFARMIEGKVPAYMAEKRYVRKDGGIIWVQVTATVVRDDLGRPIATAGIIHDITDKKRAEEELQKAQKLESIGLLAGGIAHDFNNSLTAILGNIELARMFLPPDDKAARRLAVAEKAAVRARGITRQLLTFARGGAPIKRVLPAPPLVREAAEFALQGAEVDCELDFPPDLPRVEVDEHQLRQVINNLVLNAREAMPGGGRLTVTAREEALAPGNALDLREGSYVRIDLADQGVGIPREHLGMIFDPYFTTKESGSGLGLAISFSIVKRHGGTIIVQSAPGEGSTFSVFLPASEEREAGAEAPAAEGTFPGRGRVLVMDDNPTVREIAAELLEHLGYRAETVADGAGAVRTYEEAMQEGDFFAAAILDLTVPGGMGGKEAVGHLRRVDPRARVIVSSGYDNDPIMADYADHGFDGVIAKPYKLAELGRVLRDVLGGGNEEMAVNGETAGHPRQPG